MKYCDGAGQAGFVDCDPHRGQCDKCLIERLEKENESLRMSIEYQKNYIESLRAELRESYAIISSPENP